jgi:hypothetical protein
MKKVSLYFLLILWSGSLVHADDRLRLHGTFDAGRLSVAGSHNDGFYLQTLPDPQGNVDYVSVSDGGAGPNSGLDARVVSTDRVGDEVVTPRKGDHFFRGAIYYDKDYSRMGINQSDGRNKPRFILRAGGDDIQFNFDEEGYLGFSIFTPRNYEHENGVSGRRGGVQLLSVNTHPDRTLYLLYQFVGNGDSKAHWWLMHNTSDFSVTEGGAKSVWVDLGPVEPDLGKWTDFVVRFRFNPFSVDTNPALKGIAESRNQNYRGNAGIFQVWKSEGPADESGTRAMTLKINKVNTPVGLVPHESDQIIHSFRMYKYGWHYNETTVKGPVWNGFDEIRLGSVERDGTTFSDVHPTGMNCINEKCSFDPDVPSDTPPDMVAPNPPTELRIGT